MQQPLSGLRVIEGALQYPGPYCGMLLAQLGAEVVKLEMPGTGDAARNLPGFFNSINCNKKSITLNLKEPEGRKILCDLSKDFDVFMEGFRPGVVNRLGIDYNTLSEFNPCIIYCSITGYGQDGPYRNLPGHDLNYQALSGLLNSFKDSRGNYIQPGLAIGDITSGMFSALSILSALLYRDKTGKGQYIDISMTDGLISLLSTQLGNYFETGKFERKYDAGYGMFKTADDKWIALGIAHEDWFWDRLCKALGLEQLCEISGTQRREKRNQLAGQLQEKFSQKTRKELINILSAADVPVSAVNELDQVVTDAHIKSREMLHEFLMPSGQKFAATNYPGKFSGSRPGVRNNPPRLGEHTEEFLRKQGYSLEEIGRLRENNII